MDIPTKKGYLLFPPQGVFSHIKKSWQKKYCELYRASQCGIQRLEVFDSEEDASTNLPPRIITLENCVKITPDPQKVEANVFVVVTRTSILYFASVEECEKVEWVSAFQIVAFKESGEGPAIEEDNDLYCSSGEGVFLVKLVQSDASARCGLEPGPYTLLLTSSAIQLRDSENQTLLVTWPYCFIRRYGYCDGRFTFEAGRMCDTGEGKFLVEHSNQQEIYRCLALKMRSMRKLLEGEPNVSGQLQVALSMEARSRSPIPPIPPCPHLQDHPAALRARAASQGNLLDSNSNRLHLSPTVETNPLVVINAPTHLKPRIFSASHGALDILSRKSPTLFHAKVVDIDLPNESAPPLQPKPVKPPRRPVIPEKIIYWPRNQSVTAKPVDDYDDVEVREDAWRTLGTGEPAHTEDYEPIESLDSARKIEGSTHTTVLPPQLPPPSRPKFLPLKPTSELGNYDTLQYFGNAKNSLRAAYRHIVLNTTPQQETDVSPVTPSATFHDYDQVSEHSTAPATPVSPITPASGGAPAPALAYQVPFPDDSHQGYGSIRRIPDHKLFNNLEYAVVTKPRQV